MRLPRTTGLLLALAVLAVPATAQDAAGAPMLRVVEPRAEAIERGETLTVRIRLADGATLRSARLNGIGVRRFFKPAGREVRASIPRARARGALLRGRNFLRLVVGRGSAREYESIAFTRVRRSPSLVPVFDARYQPRHGLRVMLEPSKLHVRVRVTLNGRRVSRLFAEGLPLRRVVTLGANDGLRHGRNALHVQVTHFHGQVVSFRRAFHVPRDVTIAGAGPDRRVKAGVAVRLDGRSSLPPDERRGRSARRGVRYRWTIVERPRGSRAGLVRRNASRPILRPDRPGRYRIRLATTVRPAAQPQASAAAATTSSDTTDLLSDAQPLVPVSTIATAGGKSGIAVGATRDCTGASASTQAPCFFANPGGNDQLQVLVLDRTTLELVSNRAYGLGNLAQFESDMQALILRPASGSTPATYDTTKLVLIVLRAGSVGDTGNLASGLGILNTDSKGAVSPLKGLEGAVPFSVVGVPGTLQGKAAVNYGQAIRAPDGSASPPGGLVGFLKQVADDPGSATPAVTRAFAYPDAIAYDTRANNGTSFMLGSDSLPIVPDGTAADADGLAVFSFDPLNPAGSLARAAFATSSARAGSGLAWDQLASTLNTLIGRDAGVAIVSTGDIGQFASEPKASSFLQVLQQLDQLGVNPDEFARAVAQNGTYSMISSGMRPGPPNLPGQVRAGFDASSAIAEDVPTPNQLTVGAGRLTGVVQRATYGAVIPTSGDPSGSAPEPGLLPIALSNQVPWLLTPSLDATSATCQELAFAYVATVAFDGMFPDGVPQLWTGSDASACRGVDHTGTSGTRRADTLDSNACATNDPAANGAVVGNVRLVSNTLRATYTSLDTALPAAEVQGLPMPSAAPFTQADLTCAVNQMTDELSARTQVMTFMDVLQSPQEDLQGQTVIDLGQIAEDVKVGALAPLSKQLEPQPASPASFWASFSFDALSGVAKIAAAFVPGGSTVAAGAKFIGVVGSGGQGIMSMVQSSGGNPVDATNEYLLLAAQLEQEEIDVNAQIEGALTAQQNGVKQTEEVVLSDPTKLANVNANANGVWTITATGLQQAQSIYLYRVRQLAYEDLWPQVYTGVRFNYLGACQQHSSSVWCLQSDGRWYHVSGGSGSPSSLTQARGGPGGGPLCGGPVDGSDVSVPFPAASPGDPFGLGEGSEWHPVLSVAPRGTTPHYGVYVMAETGSLTAKNLANGHPDVASTATIAPFFSQPTATVTNQSADDDDAAGFYAPDFWYENAALNQSVRCTGEDSMVLTTPGSAWTNVGAQDLWPTPSTKGD